MVQLPRVALGVLLWSMWARIGSPPATNFRPHRPGHDAAPNTLFTVGHVLYPWGDKGAAHLHGNARTRSRDSQVSRRRRMGGRPVRERRERNARGADRRIRRHPRGSGRHSQILYDPARIASTTCRSRNYRPATDQTLLAQAVVLTYIDGEQDQKRKDALIEELAKRLRLGEDDAKKIHWRRGGARKAPAGGVHGRHGVRGRDLSPAGSTGFTASAPSPSVAARAP